MTDEVLGVDSGGTKTLAARANSRGVVTFWNVGSGLDPTSDTNSDAALRSLLEECGSPSGTTALSEENSEYLKRCGFAWSDPKKP